MFGKILLYSKHISYFRTLPDAVCLHREKRLNLATIIDTVNSDKHLRDVEMFALYHKFIPDNYMDYNHKTLV